MKKIVILFLVGNISVALGTLPVDSSKCQMFVSRIFEYYTLPDTENLEESVGNFDQEKPEFNFLLNYPLKISLASKNSAVQSTIVSATGKTLEDGHYLLEIYERTESSNRNALYVIHSFSFSNDCAFKRYVVKKHLSEDIQNITLLRYFSYDSRCVRDDSFISLSDHPEYYNELCSLAIEEKTFEKVSFLRSVGI